MRLKRVYNHDAPEEEWVTDEEDCPTCGAKGVVVNEAGDGLEDCSDCEGEGVRVRQIPPVAGVEIQQASKHQKFTPHIVEEGTYQGWITMADGQIIVDGENGRLVYDIVRTPGVYCCHCGSKMGGGNRVAQAHVNNRHSGEESPDPENPAGYEQINYYDCEAVQNG